MLRILHITNWFAEPQAPHRTPFITEHLEALAPYVSQQLWHVEVQDSAQPWHLQMIDRGAGRHALLLQSSVRSWQLRELLTLLLLLILRFRLWRGGWDLVVVHIAYPLLRFPRLVRLLFGRRLLLIEHWSAYHTNFQLVPGSRSLQRLQGMFYTGIPVVAVSQALASDIRRFAARPDLSVTKVPNAVDTRLFRFDHQGSQPEGAHFLMVASWAPVKRPLFVFEAIRALVAEHPWIRLRVIGGGEQLPAMQAFLCNHQLEEAIQLLGPQSKSRIAQELQLATALLHPSDYETFSVVCAEALCCGVPVLASAVGALPELIEPANGRLVQNSVEGWTAAMRVLIVDPPAWDHASIAREASARFSRQAVGQQLSAVVHKVAALP